VVNDNLLGQEEGSGGPANFIPPLLTVNGGVDKRLSCSEELGCANKPILPQQNKSEDGLVRKGMDRASLRSVQLVRRELIFVVARLIHRIFVIVINFS
jgi:hypothetical protein